MLLTRQSAKTKAERGEKNFHKAVQVVKVAEHMQFWPFVSVCHLPNHSKRKVAAHKLKLGK